jgi:hypothetical protein
VSVAVGHEPRRGFRVLREAIRPLEAWDAAARSTVTLEPGALLSCCQVHRGRDTEVEAGFEPYVMEFESSGRQYTCALFRFQPRTQAVELVWVQGIPACEAVAV